MDTETFHKKKKHSQALAWSDVPDVVRATRFLPRACKHFQARNFRGPSTSTPGRICRSRELPPDSRLDFHARGDVARAEARLDSRMMGADIWCHAACFQRESVSTGGEQSELHTTDKVVRERRRINAAQTSVTMYTYGRGGDLRVGLPRGNRSV